MTMKVKVILVFKNNDRIEEEVICAEKMEDGHYKVDNIPFYAPNLALNDVFSVEEDEGILYFDQLIRMSGHSTIQLMFFEETEVNESMAILENFGCSWEGMKDQAMYSVDVPTELDYAKVKRFLNEQLEKGILDFKEACLMHQIESGL